jgi:hypothetical protein
VVCLAPRALKDSVRPRRLAGVVGRPLNFTVRRFEMPSQGSRPITVAGHKLTWSVRHWPKWTAAGLLGMSVEVVPVGSPKQRLIIEFPRGSVRAHRMSPERARPKVTSDQIAELAQSALAAGWSPDSRGKPFVLQVEASNNRSRVP